MHLEVVLGFLAFASSSVAIPAAAQEFVAATLGTAVGGALAPTVTPRPKQNIAAPPRYLTISIINSHGAAITTSHARNAGAPAPVGGQPAPGTMKKGATASIAVPTGWAGNIAVNDARYRITGDDSLIEANFVRPSGESVAVADVDISYVNGFTLPLVCSCSGKVVTGCNKDLKGLNTCPNPNGQNACKNPLRADTSATQATPYFRPCQHVAYTYPKDDAANSYGQCQSGRITCCVGHTCPKNPKQT